MDCKAVECCFCMSNCCSEGKEFFCRLAKESFVSFLKESDDISYPI